MSLPIIYLPDWKNHLHWALGNGICCPWFQFTVVDKVNSLIKKKPTIWSSLMSDKNYITGMTKPDEKNVWNNYGTITKRVYINYCIKIFE